MSSQAYRFSRRLERQRLQHDWVYEVASPFRPPRLIHDIPFKQTANPVSNVRGVLQFQDFGQFSGGKGSHRKLVHPRYRGAVTLSGQLGDDAKPYQEKQVRRAIEEVQK